MSNEQFNTSRLNVAANMWFLNWQDYEFTVYVTLIGNAGFGSTSTRAHYWQNEFGSSALPVTSYTRKSLVSSEHYTIDEPYDPDVSNDQVAVWGPTSDITWENTTAKEYWPVIEAYALLSKDVDFSALPDDASRQQVWEKNLIGYFEFSNANVYRKSLWPGDRVSLKSSVPYTDFNDFALAVGG